MDQLSGGRGTQIVRKVRTGHLLDSLQHMQDTRMMCKCFRASWREKEGPETIDAYQVLATDTCACTVAAYEEKSMDATCWEEGNEKSSRKCHLHDKYLSKAVKDSISDRTGT